MQEKSAARTEADKIALQARITKLQNQRMQLKSELKNNLSPGLGSGSTCQLALPLHMPEQHRTEGTAIHDKVWAQSLMHDIWDDRSMSGHDELPAEDLAALDMNAEKRGCRPSTFGESVDEYEKAFADHRI